MVGFLTDGDLFSSDSSKGSVPVNLRKVNERKKRITEAITYMKPDMPECVEEDTVYHHATATIHFGILFLLLNFIESGYITVVCNQMHILNFHFQLS